MPADSPITETSYLCLWRVGDRSRRQELREVKARHANSVVRHSVIDIKTIR